MNTALDAINFMVKHLDKTNLTAAVSCVLIQLYMPTDLVGYRTLAITILAYRGDPEQSFTKELYVDVGHQLGVSKEKVEKDIRDAIKKAWKRRDKAAWWPYFPQKKKPTNKEFITRIAEIIDLWQEAARKEVCT